MGRYKGKCEEKENEEEEEVVVDAKIRGRTMAKGRRTNMTAAKTKKKVSVSTTPYSVYDLRSRRRKRSHNSTETTAFEEATNYTSSTSDVIVSSSDLHASCCSSNIASTFSAFTHNSASTSSEIVQDLEVESSEETSSKFVDGNKSVSEIEMSNLRESKSDGGVDYPTTKPAVEIKSMMMMPSEFEIEEFFSSAEKDLHKRFSDKYNFDVVKDVPLEGRYEWVEIKQ